MFRVLNAYPSAYKHLLKCVIVRGWLQRVMTCLQEVCLEEKSTLGCRDTFLDCGFGAPKAPYRDARGQWIKSTNASGSCLIQTSPYEFGIYQPMGMQVLTIHPTFICSHFLKVCCRVFHNFLIILLFKPLIWLKLTTTSGIFWCNVRCSEVMPWICSIWSLDWHCRLRNVIQLS